ncbi:hypothetical protein K7X08_021801 [Anisodus acutangulus]|uniref:Thioredoxin domain-containing protein n=1 Tax=Anisodus acutangulus TaxID=402998 RepID=A0A9Q1RE75_9SOLA|nr:hypothetical protein K7X08_021801 [Anisodus acutangulus]
MDKVQEIVEKQVLTVAKAVEDKLDEEISALDRLDLDDIEVLRERRLQQMKKMAEKRSRWMSLGHGEYSEIPNEKEFFSVVKASERVVCHFYRENWPCKVMDKHLSILAKQHVETRFVKINAEKSPYLAEKLRIVVLPTLAVIKNAKVDNYVVGFDELGGTDDFSTEELEERLAKAEVVIFEAESSRILSKSKAQTKKSVRQSSNPDSSDSETFWTIIVVLSNQFAFTVKELCILVDDNGLLKKRLEDAGYAVGARILEFLCHREKGNRRETRLVGILSFVHSTVWKVADSLEKGTEHEDEYMISEKELLVNRFISIPKDTGAFNCGAFVAGIVRVSQGKQRRQTTILIKFAEEVLRREARLGLCLFVIIIGSRLSNHLMIKGWSIHVEIVD